VAAETEFERVLQVIEAQMFRAPCIGSIKKRTMLARLRHTNFIGPAQPAA
jgi:hypothetical protein